MGAGVGSFEEVAVDELAGEADLHADAGLGCGVVGGGDEVVEGAVEVGQRDVDGDAGDREGRGGFAVALFRRHLFILPPGYDRLRHPCG
ncbi:hypothetical protein GCM10010435_00970 [Winogradskya consettensis]|uniref:Uncharacterized protein n=1 Tax=Winogradskya consettensis TaxID=113560 RepID=A0A919S837_9ACTN|nr:hypothetical protein Aco04nite_01980 [Actinoplanes consettensis]